MKLLIFAKKRTANDGKIFYNYLSTLVRKSTGEAVPVQVKFRQECGAPDPHKCPVYINVNKEDCNLSTRELTNEEDNTVKKVNTLWVSKWADGGKYVDTSLDDIDALG